LFLLFYNSPKCPLSPLSSRLCVSCRTSTDRFRTCTGCSTGCLILRHTAQRLEARSVPVLGHRRLRPETRRKYKNTVRLSYSNEFINVRMANCIDGFVFIYIYNSKHFAKNVKTYIHADGCRFLNRLVYFGLRENEKEKDKKSVLDPSIGCQLYGKDVDRWFGIFEPLLPRGRTTTIIYGRDTCVVTKKSLALLWYIWRGW